MGDNVIMSHQSALIPVEAVENNQQHLVPCE